MASNESAVLFDQPGPKGRKTIRIVNWIAGIIFAVVVVLILMRLHNPPDGENQLSWELWKPALDAEAWTDFYLPGLWATIRASVLAVVGAWCSAGLWCGPTAAEPADPYHFRRDRGIRTSRPRSAAHDLLLALVRLRRSAQPRVLGGGARACDLQRIRGGRAGAFRRGQPAERPA